MGIIETDAKGIIKIFNKGAENLLGYTAKEVVDKVTPGIFHDKEEIKASLDVAQTQNKRLLNFAHIISHNLRSHTANMSMILEMISVENTPTAEHDFFPLLQNATENLKETIHHLNEVVVMNAAPVENLVDLNLFEYVEKSIMNVKALALEAACTIQNKVNKNMSEKPFLLIWKVLS